MLALFAGGVFIAVVLFLMKSSKLANFDKQDGNYYKGQKKKTQNIGKLLEKIYALQIIEEEVIAGIRNTGKRSFISYELNLVFSDGGRENILHHSDEKSLLVAAKKVGHFLDVPVWRNNPYKATTVSSLPLRVYCDILNGWFRGWVQLISATL